MSEEHDWAEPNEAFDSAPVGQALADALKIAAPDGGSYLLGRWFFRKHHSEGKTPYQAIHFALSAATKHADNRSKRMAQAKHAFKVRLRQDSKSNRNERNKERRTRSTGTGSTGPIIDGPAALEETKNLFGLESTPQPA